MKFIKAQKISSRKGWKLYRCSDYYRQTTIEGKPYRYRYYKTGFVVFDGEVCHRWQRLSDFVTNCLENDRWIDGWLRRD